MTLLTGCTSTPASPGPGSIDLDGPLPSGMLPLGPTKGPGQPPAPCVPGAPVGVPVVILYEARPVDAPRPAGVGELVGYDWHGHRPLAAESLHVTVPALTATLRPLEPRMRLAVGVQDGSCFAAWRITARSLAGFDGGQDRGTGWQLLGDGNAQTDTAVVKGLPEGDWVVHVHLGWAVANAEPTDSIESYARVAVGSTFAVQAQQVPPPSLAARCPISLAGPAGAPDMVLTVEGSPAPTKGIAGTVDTNAGGGLLPAAIPTQIVRMRPGSLLEIRTADGTCGNDWGGVIFSPVPDAVGILPGGSGLASNNGSDPNSPTPQLVGGVNAGAPAPGEWIIRVDFWFGGPGAATYYWRISVGPGT